MIGLRVLGPCLTVVPVLLLAGRLSAQDVPVAPAPEPSVMVRPVPFASWEGEAHLAAPGSSAAVATEARAAWWLGTGATVGAAAALTLTQAFCGDDNGCVGRSVGAALLGTLVGGALESGMDY